LIFAGAKLLGNDVDHAFLNGSHLEDPPVTAKKKLYDRWAERPHGMPGPAVVPN
jgi:hypothetical protein